MQKIIEWFKNLFRKPTPRPVIVHNANPEVPSIPDAHDEVNNFPEIDWDSWIVKAINLTQKFEGTVPWANVTGNFDGALLTCGSIGFTWIHGNQQPMILEFIEKHGELALLKLMPKSGREYIRAAKLGISEGGKIVKAWSVGETSKIKEPYYSELTAFWKSPEMRPIQIKFAWKLCGNFAKQRATDYAKFSGQPISFQWFWYWFDEAVLNGTSKSVDLTFLLNDAEINRALYALKNYTVQPDQYLVTEFRQNIKLLSQNLKPDESRDAYIAAAFTRALKSRYEFIPVTFCRRFAIANKKGYVNGQLFNFERDLETP